MFYFEGAERGIGWCTVSGSRKGPGTSWWSVITATPTLEDDVFYSDTESSDSSMDTTSDADDERSDDSSMSAH